MGDVRADQPLKPQISPPSNSRGGGGGDVSAEQPLKPQISDSTYSRGDFSALRPLKPQTLQRSINPRGRRGRRPGASSYHYPLGSLIEIQTNDADFCGVYFSATVIPPPLSPKRSSRKPFFPLCVEYHNLLANEDGPDRLKEYVHPSIVRPAPPLQQVVANDFVPNDVVDAFYNDGWWTGVISRVLEGGERFLVTFENPPDQLEFGISELRVHWDWVDGLWVGPLKQRDAAFEVGMKVEVSLEREGDGFVGAWFPATILQVLENGAFSVEFKDKSGICVRGEVDSLHVRPCPPILKDVMFEESVKVDVFFNFGWWSGLISKKLDNGYMVELKQMAVDNVFNRSELRPRMDWKDGKWFILSSLIEKSDNQKTPSSSKRRRRASIPCSDSGGAPKKRNGGGEIDHPNLENEVTTIENVVDLQVEDPLNMLDVENVAGKVGSIEEIMRTPPLIDEPRRLASTEAVTEPDAMVDENTELQSSLCVAGMTADSALVDKSSVEVATELPNLPFVKRNGVWKAFESMEVFRRIPQNPHFEPLLELKESSREGLAIACMVNFTNVVDRSCCLKINDPKCMFEDINETLSDLETHGFDVAVVQQRVMKLLAAKEKEEELVQEMIGLNKSISDHIQLKKRTEKEIGVIKEHLRRLKEQLVIEELAEAKEVQEIARLQSEVKEIEERIKGVRCDFKAAVEVVAPPLDDGGSCNGS